MKNIVCVTGKLNGTIREIMQIWAIDVVDLWVGIDRGALFLLEEGYPVDLAIGDFDSLNEKERELVFASAKELVQAPVEKDDTDTQLALEVLTKNSEEANVSLIGGLDGRLDHLWSILMLPLEERFSNIFKHFRILEKNSGLQVLQSGQNKIPFKKGWQFGITCLTPVENLSIQNAKYNLENTTLHTPKVYTSNEFLENQDVICQFESGVVVAIFVKEGKDEKNQ